jgi:hypothetical protein
MEIVDRRKLQLLYTKRTNEAKNKITWRCILKFCIGRASAVNTFFKYRKFGSI